MTMNEHTIREQEFERLDNVYDLIYGTHGDFGGWGYTCVQGCVTDGTYGAWHGHVLAVLLDQERPLPPERIEITNPNDPRWRDGAVVDLEWAGEGVRRTTERCMVADGDALGNGLPRILALGFRVYLVSEAPPPPDPRAEVIRSFVDDISDAEITALLARLDEVQA